MSDNVFDEVVELCREVYNIRRDIKLTLESIKDSIVDFVGSDVDFEPHVNNFFSVALTHNGKLYLCFVGISFQKVTIDVRDGQGGLKIEVKVDHDNHIFYNDKPEYSLKDIEKYFVVAKEALTRVKERLLRLRERVNTLQRLLTTLT